MKSSSSLPYFPDTSEKSTPTIPQVSPRNQSDITSRNRHHEKIVHTRIPTTKEKIDQDHSGCSLVILSDEAVYTLSYLLPTPLWYIQ